MKQIIRILLIDFIIGIVVCVELFIIYSINLNKLLMDDQSKFRNMNIGIISYSNDKNIAKTIGFGENECKKAASNLRNSMLDDYKGSLRYVIMPSNKDEGILKDIRSTMVFSNDNISKKCEKLLIDMRYFPVAMYDKNKEEVTFKDTWNTKRTYGGDRIHEGTDIMAENNKVNYYPVLSISDGIVEKKGWLELGGYRIGIRNNNDVYIYYAHLQSYANDIEEGDYVRAGQIIGFMGNTGYGEEGTSGKFDAHLHLGFYIRDGDDDVSINPYYILKYLEKFKIYYKICK